jgi:hypothetical protein
LVIPALLLAFALKNDSSYSCICIVLSLMLVYH